MIADREPRLHALSVFPRTARSGDVVCFTFRARNHGCRPTEMAQVQFVLCPEFEALAATDVALDPVAPDGELRATVTARIATALTDRTELIAHAILTSAHERYASNGCTVLVRTAARFCAKRSGTIVERIDRDHVRARAWATNDGDGPAIDALLTLFAPPGCARIAGDGPVRVAMDRLAPGNRIEAELEARITEPGAEVCADNATIGWSNVAPIALRSAGALALAAEIEEPIVRVLPGSGRAAVTVDIRNGGWSDAHAVAVTIDLPDPLRMNATSFMIDGLTIPLRASRNAGAALASARRDEASLVIVLARIPAQATTQLAFELACPLDGSVCELGVRTEAHTASVIIAAPARIDVRLRLVDLPRWVEPGGTLVFSVEVINGGPVMQRISIAVDGDLGDVGAAALVVRPGTHAVVRLRGVVADRAHDSGSCTGNLIARAGDRELARVGFAVPVRDDARLIVEGAPFVTGEQNLPAHDMTYDVRNVGTTTARGLMLRANDRTTPLEPIQPGALVTISLPHGATHGDLCTARGVAIRLRAPENFAHETLALELCLPPRAFCGAAFRVRLIVRIAERVDQWCLTQADLGGCMYVAGSATIDGRCLGEPNDGSPVIDGLRLFGIAANTTLELEWSLVAVQRSDGSPIALRIAVDADGRLFETRHDDLIVDGRATFALSLPNHRYFVDAVRGEPALTQPTDLVVETIERGPEGNTDKPEFSSHGEHVPASRSSDADGVTILALRATWSDDTRRLLGRSDDDGLLTHIFVLRALFPDVIANAQPPLVAALDEARSALRDVFDRLFVKIRIPGFPVDAEDIEDPTLRHALANVFAALGNARSLTTGELFPAGSSSVPHAVYACVDAQTARTASATLATAGFGSPSMLRTLIALLPTRSDADTNLADALVRYVADLDGALARFVDEPAAAFDEALTTGRYPDLEASRRSLVALLDDRSARPVEW